MEEDIGQQIIDKLTELDLTLSNAHNKAKTLKKNSHLHLLIETDVINKMKEKAESQNISLSEWCRQKLIGNPQLDRIEGKLDEILKKV